MSYLPVQAKAAPIIVKGEPITVFIMVLVFILVFLLFWVWATRTIGAAAIAPGGSSSIGGKLLLQCGPGECGTNMISGEKTCPDSDSDVVLIDPESQVCNPKFTCTSPQTPYALQADGSTNEFGICEANTTCRCLKNSQCATHVACIFTTVNGSVFSQSGSNRFTFSQVPLEDATNASNNVLFDSLGTDFCGIKTSHLNRLSPGSCTFTDADYQNATGTLNLATSCVNTNPCVKGVMVFDPGDPSLVAGGVGINEVLDIPITCVDMTISQDTAGNPYPNNQCPAGMVPYYNQNWNLILCTKINYSFI